MADDRRLSADEVASRTFATSFRGFDAAEVRAYLASLAESLRAAEERETALARRLAEAEDRASRPDIDEDTLLRLLGDETARVMRSAREAAADLKAKAEENAEQILREAHEEAKRTRAAADNVLAERSQLAEAEAAQVVEAARTEAAGLIATAESEADRLLGDVKDRAKAMVVEAQAARERILADLTRRRRIAHVQVEQLRAGRDRLLEAYRLVRSTLEEVTEELQNAEAEARHAAEAAARRLAAEDYDDRADEAPPQQEEAGAEAPAADDDGPAVRLLPAPAPVEEEPAPGEVHIAAETAAEAVEDEPEADGEPSPILVTTTVKADSPAPVTAEPSRPASVPVEEKRLSSLKVVRRDESPEPVAVAQVTDLTVVEPQPAGESVRVVTSSVDDVFAKLRASREESVAKAREVLSEPAPVAAAAEPEPTPALAPVGEQPVSNDDERALQERDEAVAEIESTLARKLKRGLQDEQNDVLDRLRSAKAKTAESVLPDVEAHVARHVAVAMPFLQQAGKGVDVGPVARELAEAVVMPLRRSLERAFTTTDDEVEPSDRIGMAYREWKGDRIERLAGDAVLTAWSRAAYAAVPDGTVLRWVVDDQGHACPDCDDNALAGPTAKGEQYPTGQEHPPAHAGCRCLLVRAAT